MQTSVFIGRILGPCCIIVAVGLILNRNFYLKIIEGFAENDVLVYLAGILSLLIGLLIVASHNLWVANWRLLITFFGWAGLIKGIWLIILPKSISKVIKVYQKNPKLLLINAVIMVIFGAFLAYKSYF